MSLSLSHWYPGSGVVLDCINSLLTLHVDMLFITFKFVHIDHTLNLYKPSILFVGYTYKQFPLCQGGDSVFVSSLSVVAHIMCRSLVFCPGFVIHT